MSFAGILRKLFQNAGAGPYLRPDILPAVTAQAPGAVPAGGLPGQVLQIGDDGRVVWGKNAGVPSRLIGEWAGAVEDIPIGWALCDGKNGTPDLRDKFIVGAGGAYAPGATGGAASAVPAVTVGATTLTIAQMPVHAHGGVVTASGGSFHGSSGDYNNRGEGGTANAGGGQAHTHAASVDSLSLLPPYYALCYIMKL